MDSSDPGFGYDAANGTFGDMVKNGILDPLKVMSGSALIEGVPVVVYLLLIRI